MKYRSTLSGAAEVGIRRHVSQVRRRIEVIAISIPGSSHSPLSSGGPMWAVVLSKFQHLLTYQTYRITNGEGKYSGIHVLTTNIPMQFALEDNGHLLTTAILS